MTNEPKKIFLDAGDLCLLARGKIIEDRGQEIELDLVPAEIDTLEKAIELLKVRLCELEEMGADQEDSEDSEDSDSEEEEDSEEDEEDEEDEEEEKKKDTTEDY